MTVICGPERWPFWQPAASLPSESRTPSHSPRRRFTSREPWQSGCALVGPTADREHTSSTSDRLDRARPLLGTAPPRVGRARRDGRGQHSLASRARSSSSPAAWRARRTMLTGPGRSSASTGSTKPRRSGRSRSSPPIAATWSVQRVLAVRGLAVALNAPVHLPSRGRARAHCRLERGPAWCRSPIQRSRAADEPRRWLEPTLA